MGYGAQDLGRPATFEDIEALPEHLVGEVIDGTLYVHGRPPPWGSYLQGQLLHALWNPFHRAKGGPGGWWIFREPGIRAGGSPEFVPDFAGWRRERAPHLPERWELVPDWACEIVTNATRAFDHRIKRAFYARLGIGHLWFIDLEDRTLSVSELTDGHWSELGVYGDGDVVRVIPFDAIELNVSDLWPHPPEHSL